MKAKKDLQGWLHTSSQSSSASQHQPYDSDDEMAPGAEARAASSAAATFAIGDAPAEDWPAFLSLAEARIRSGSSKARTSFMSGGLVTAAKSKSVSSSQRAELLARILHTYGRFSDRSSHLAALTAGTTLLRCDAAQDRANSEEPKGLPMRYAVGFLSREAERLCKAAGSGPTSAPAVRIALLSWLCAVFATLVDSFTSSGTLEQKDNASQSPHWQPLVSNIALVLDSLLGGDELKPSGRLSVLRIVRKTVRSSHAELVALIHTIVSTPTGPAAFRAVVLLGVVTDVALRLRSGRELQKGSSDGFGRRTLGEAKKDILTFYTANVISSKVAVPEHVPDSLRDFIAAEVTEEDVTTLIRPPLEKMLLRSPEIALLPANAFFSAYHGDLTPHLKGLQGSIMSASRSSAPATRARAVAFFGTLVSRTEDATAVKNVSEDMLSTLKAGKASSPEQRGALFDMLAGVKPASDQSASITEVIAVVLGKENNESAMQAAVRAITSHTAWLLSQGQAPPASVATSLAKELQNPKVPLRKLVCIGVGETLWGLSSKNATPASLSFGEALLPGLAFNLKTATTSPLTSQSGPLEGYIAVAALIGRMGGWSSAKIDSFIADNAVIQGMAAGGAKPSFVLWDKIYRRATGLEEETWHVRALESVILRYSAKLAGDQSARTAAALALSHCVLSSNHREASQAAVESVRHIVERDAALGPQLVHLGLSTWLEARHSALPTAGSSTSASTDAEGVTVKPKSYQRILRLLLQATIPSSNDVAEGQCEDILVRFLVLAHHPVLQDRDRDLFVDLMLRAKVDPPAFVENKLAQLLSSCDEAKDLPYLREAAYPAMSTLVLIAPSLVSQALTSQVITNVAKDDLANLTQQDLGIWHTPPGTLFVDILAAKKDKQAVDKNRKDANIEAWEAELRESIARKKAAANKTFTKEEQRAIDTQLKLEAEVRARVTLLEQKLVHAMRTIDSIVMARSEGTQGVISTLTLLVSDLLASPHAMIIANQQIHQAVTSLVSVLSPRLAEYEASLRLALLRSVDEELISEDLRREPLGDLTLRVLYRVRFVSEAAPLDLGSVSLISPLITRVIFNGGLGVAETDAESIAEQVQLALDFMGFHAAASEDPRFPRILFVDNVVHVVAKHTQLAQEAVAIFRSLGEAIKTNATQAEIAVILRHTLADETYVRSGSLQALQPLDLTHMEYCVELWVACHDSDGENARLAEKAWEENAMDVPSSYMATLVPLLEHENNFVRIATGAALTEAARLHPESVTALVGELRKLYDLRAVELKPELDMYGLVRDETVGREDPWRARAAVALAFQKLAPLFNGTDVEPFFDFLIAGGALGDRNEEVRQKMLEAGTAVIDARGGDTLSGLIHMFESYLSHPTPAFERDDGVTEAVIILFGRLARHLEPADTRVTQVVDRLIAALATPSETVQVAVTDCLPPLVRSLGDATSPMVDRLFADLIHGEKYALRRGSAYGLAGLIKGRGISSIAEYRIMQRLADAIEDKKNPQSRQGAMMAYETFSATLQRLFEPYVPSILPHMLASFGDTSTDVREATQDTARVLMTNLSGYCVKVVLPTLLDGLEDKQWRTKKGAIELLGAMAYCAPKQLSAALPTIIPSLNEPLKDSHTQVRQSAERAIKGFGEVIRNPEIKKLVPTLLKALIDPNAKTATAQSRLLKTTFVHYIDAPSLALVIPVIDRGMRERSAQVQKDAAKIVGNLASLTDAKDFTPYLQTLVPLIRTVLVSPVPEARAVAARALGTLVERLGEVYFVELVPSLLQVLRSDATGVDRQGSAQGLAEVLAALGMERMESLLPELIAQASSSRPYVRVGHLTLLIYLPATFGVRFAVHLPRILPPIVSGIADESESVREVSMRAGRMVIAQYSSEARQLLLPELERGMFDESWRVRLSSIQLVAELLYKLSGISGANDVADDEEGGEGNEENAVVGNSIQRQLMESLGKERRDRILAGIYILRQDSVINVRQTAQNVWKTLVANTPRTAREVLAVMLDLIIQALAAEGVEQGEMAGRTLGELVAKLGERILGECIPLLRLKGAEASDAQLRAGVCFAVTEVLSAATRSQLDDHEDSLIAIVRHGLVDESAKVRQAAASAFDALQRVIGPRAIDETIPTLLGALQEGTGSSETALAALREVMRARGDVVFPVVVPTLTKQPISAFNARAISALVRVAGSSLTKKLSSILGALSTSLEREADEKTRSDLEGAVSSILSSVSDFEGLHQLMLLLLGWAGDRDNPKQRVRGCRFFATFCSVKRGDVDISDYHQDWVRRLLSLFEDRTSEVVDEAWTALDALLKTVPKGEVENLVVPMRRTLETTGAPGEELPGLCRPKGPAPLVPVFLAGLLNGTAEQREQGAYGLADIVERTSADAIKPFVIQMVGPLIRACGDRHPGAVKAAILVSLTTTLRVVPQHTKAFLPQLQRSFQKAVSDASLNVRSKAATALGVLMALQARVDPVILELVAGSRPAVGGPAPAAAASAAGSAQTGPVPDAKTLAESSLSALAQVLAAAPAKNIGAAAREAVSGLVEEAFQECAATGTNAVKDGAKVVLADVFGALVALGDPRTAEGAPGAMRIFAVHISQDAPEAQLASLCLAASLERASGQTFVIDSPTRLARAVGHWCTCDASVARPARQSREIMQGQSPWKDNADVLDVL
ncbi:ARM repeat-containing protein [Ceraceosorus guamensis]|uniref:ARM repeat-containing protein n=1 Tax=Ceraceosorus guamensis TaxID=1522189 RepID=A0A316VPZ8_9BASI|nr:ARM repeat-containing protein [Ceraceosorus guamensis]PWN39719.1 ARM repeat-containing protein [Ceraceosorus guamensis]